MINLSERLCHAHCAASSNEKIHLSCAARPTGRGAPPAGPLPRPAAARAWKHNRHAGQAGSLSVCPCLLSSAGSGNSSGMIAFLGDQGYVPLVSLASRQWVANLKMNGSARCAAYTPDGHELLTLGEVAIWSGSGGRGHVGSIQCATRLFCPQGQRAFSGWVRCFFVSSPEAAPHVAVAARLLLLKCGAEMPEETWRQAVHLVLQGLAIRGGRVSDLGPSCRAITIIWAGVCVQGSSCDAQPSASRVAEPMILHGHRAARRRCMCCAQCCAVIAARRRLHAMVSSQPLNGLSRDCTLQLFCGELRV